MEANYESIFLRDLSDRIEFKNWVGSNGFVNYSDITGVYIYESEDNYGGLTVKKKLDVYISELKENNFKFSEDRLICSFRSAAFGLYEKQLNKGRQYAVHLSNETLEYRLDFMKKSIEALGYYELPLNSVKIYDNGDFENSKGDRVNFINAYNSKLFYSGSRLSSLSGRNSVINTGDFTIRKELAEKGLFGRTKYTDISFLSNFNIDIIAYIFNRLLEYGKIL